MSSKIHYHLPMPRYEPDACQTAADAEIWHRDEVDEVYVSVTVDMPDGNGAVFFVRRRDDANAICAAFAKASNLLRRAEIETCENMAGPPG